MPLSAPLESTDRRRDLLAVIALGFAVVVSYLAPVFTSDGVKDPTAFVDAIRSIRDTLSPGDRVVIHPPWRDDATRAVLAANVLPPGVEVSEAFNPRHGDRWGRVVFVIDRGASGLPAEVRRRVGDFGTTLGDEGGLRVVLVDDSDLAAPSFAAYLAGAQVSVESSVGAITRCKWDRVKARHVCPGLPGWMHVGEEDVVTEQKRERCVWAHPISGGKVSIRFEGTTVGPALTLAHALADSAMSNKSGAPVTASVFVDGKLIGRDAKQNRAGFDTRTFKVPPAQQGTKKNVSVEITTRDDGARHYCFRLASEDVK